MSIEIVPFENKHHEQMKSQGVAMADFGVFGLPKMLFTGFVDGKIVAVAGLVKMWPGVAEAMSVMTPSAKPYMKSIHRKSRDVITEAIKKWGLHRIQTVVWDASPAGRKWVEALGFEIESPMKKYGPHQETVLRYVIFPNGRDKNDNGQ